ncbi:MAG: CsiV family protein [Legionella sp.]|uniref:CsiV family protein n=1 Tax=Legionella sp. TaxID=459 RepID=UPI0039E642AE
MQRLFILMLSMLSSSVILAAKSEYQIDLIIFAQHPTMLRNDALPKDAPLIPINKGAIFLKVSSSKPPRPYALLPKSYSSLSDEYYQLSRRSSYPILAYYSWRQPANNQSTVTIPLTEHNGWQIQGTLRVSQTNYYTFDAYLQVSPPSNPQSSFTVAQKHRLKKDQVYYLDNDHIGMIVKIHQIT